MSKLISSSIIDTPIAGVTPVKITLPTINYDADYRMKATSGSNDVVMMNTTASLEEDEQIRIAASEISNIYSNTAHKPDQNIVSKSGYSLLVQISKNVKIVDETNPAYAVNVPISAHLVLKFPKNEAITNDVIQSLVSRLNAALYEQGSCKALALLKGAINPKGL